MQKKLFILIMALAAFALQSCEKDPIPQDSQLVTQTFSIHTDVDESPMKLKSWDRNTWVYNYNTIGSTLTLTGTGSNVGINYTKTNVTIDQLKAGTVSITMLPGTYNVTYSTPHTRTTDVFSVNGLTASGLQYQPMVGDNLDILVNNSNVTVTGSPLSLTATLDDVLIIVDIPTIPTSSATDGVRVSKDGFVNNQSRLIYSGYTTGNYHWGYFSMAANQLPLEIRFTVGGVVKTIDCSSYVKGNAYHLVSAFDAATQITIPNMVVNTVVVP